MSEWIIQQGDPRVVGKRISAAPVARGRRVGPGVAKKERERRAQLEKDLMLDRVERLRKAIGGELDVRAGDGQRVERLTMKPSTSVEMDEAIVVDPPLRRGRGSKQLPADIEIEQPESYAKSVVSGAVVINGKEVGRDEDTGGDHGGYGVRRLN